MDFLNIAIPTAGMWILDAAVITPIAKAIGGPVALPKAIPVAQGAAETATHAVATGAKAKADDVPIGPYIGVSMAVMAVAGIIAGLAGCPLIGVSLKARHWPGLIALIVASLFAYSLTGGNF